jgi:hypothetical protein
MTSRQTLWPLLSTPTPSPHPLVHPTCPAVHALLQGCYDVGLPSHKSLFQLHAERLLAVQCLAAAAAGAGTQAARIPWYIMTSPFTHEDTV